MLTRLSQFVIFASTSAQIIDNATVEWIDQWRTIGGVPGLAVTVVATPHFKDTRGNATLDDNGGLGHGSNGTGEWGSQILTFGNATADQGVDADTIFAMGSNSKLLAALSLGMLIHNQTALPDNASLTLDTKVKDVLPGFGLSDPYANDHVSVLDFLAMHSGLPGHDFAATTESAASAVSKMRHWRMSTEIRSAFQYNNQHYVAISEIVAHLSGMAYPDFVHEHIFKPLGMSSAGYNRTAAPLSGHWSDAHVATNQNFTACGIELAANNGTSVPHSCVGDARAVRWLEDSDGYFFAGSGGLLMSSNDAVIFLRELLQPRVIPVSVVQAVGISRVVSSQSVFPELSASTYGMGQEMMTYRGHNAFFHGGTVPGHNTIVARAPSLGIGIAILTNHDPNGSLIAQIVLYRIVDNLLGLEPIAWNTRLLAGLVGGTPDGPKSPPPGNPPSTPWDDIPGTYSNPGYYNFSLERDDGTLLLPEEHAYLTGMGVNLTGPVFVASLPAVVGNRLAITHFDGDYFNATAFLTLPAVDGNGSVVMPEGEYPAVIARGGLGMFGGWWRGDPSVTNPPVVDKGAEETAEVWFKKV